jgi:LysR family transcriptional regulator for bpeEF and oprC
MDQLTAMRVFIRIAEAGTFAKAADALNIPRPTATKLVQDLESHLGVKLLQRTTRRVTVTPEGATYYERATRLLSDLEDMDSLAARTRAQPKGRVRVDIGSSLANFILIPALPNFHERYPDIQLDVGVSDRPADLIGEGVDCAIRGGVLADTSLVARRIAESDYITCASPAYLQRHGTPLHPTELTSAHGLIPYFSSLTGRTFPLYFQRNGEELEIQGHRRCAVNESTAHLTSLLTGLGISQTFRFMAQPHLDTGALVRLFPEWTRPRQPLHVVYPQTRHLNAKLRVFVDWVAKVFARVDDRPD